MLEVTNVEIRLGDMLDERWAAHFEPFKLASTETGTRLTGPVHDQAELFGLLLRIRDLGLRLVSVNPVPPE